MLHLLRARALRCLVPAPRLRAAGIAALRVRCSSSTPKTGAVPKVHVPSGGRTGKHALELNELRLIAVDGTQLGVLPGSRALELAAQDGLELVEVAPKASPPVWRLVRQQSIVVAASRRQEAASREPPATSAEPAEESDEEKRVAAVRKRAALGKKPRVKEVRLLDRCQEHDVAVKMKNAVSFLGKGYVVKGLLGRFPYLALYLPQVTVAAVATPDGSQQTDRARELVLRFVEGCAEVATAGGLAKSGRHVSTTLEPKGG